MATTTYHIFSLDAEGNEVSEIGHKSKKATAVDAARAHRKESGEGVRVKTNAGTTVFEQNAKKTIKMSPRYTRVVELPEGVQAPNGLRVAYVRPRRNGAVLHDAEAQEYRILNLATGEVLDEVFETTRDAGAFLKAGVPLPAPANA